MYMYHTRHSLNTKIIKSFNWLRRMVLDAVCTHETSSKASRNESFIPILCCTIKPACNFSVAYTVCKKSAKYGDVFQSRLAYLSNDPGKILDRRMDARAARGGKMFLSDIRSFIKFYITSPDIDSTAKNV